MSKVKSQFHQTCKSKQTDFQENRLFSFYSLLAKNRFKWEGLPEGLESRHIEDFLYYNGQGVMFTPEGTSTITFLPCTCEDYNILGDPLRINAFGYNNQFYDVDLDTSVRCLSNDDCIPNSQYVEYYTSLLAEIENTINANLLQQKFPFMFPCSKDTESTMKAIYNKMKEGEPAIFYDKMLDMGGDRVGFQAVKTEVPFLLNELQEFKNNVVTEMLTYLGLNNTKNDKKERMLVDEVNVNNSHILMNVDIEFKNRERFAEQCNKILGTNIKVVKTIDELQANFFGEQQNTEGLEKGKGKEVE